MSNGNKLGSWAFLGGVVVASLLSLGMGGVYTRTLVWVLFLLGLVVGLLNVTVKETHEFMVAGAVLTLVSYLGINVGVFTDTEIVLNMLRSILALFVPATVVVALQAVFELARN